MIRLLASLPQGIFWYPLLLLFCIALGRVLWSVSRRPSVSHRNSGPESGHLIALKGLVARAQVDHFARLELERRVIGLLLQANGYSGYTVENCRELSATLPDSPISNSIDRHLDDSQVNRVGEWSQSADSEQRINQILEAVEHLTEAPHE